MKNNAPTISDEIPREEATRNLPEYKLITAFLCRNILDYLREAHKEHRGSASAWFHSNDKREFSFIWVCSYLDMDDKVLLRNIHKQESSGLSLDVDVRALKGIVKKAT